MGTAVATAVQCRAASGAGGFGGSGPRSRRNRSCLAFPGGGPVQGEVGGTDILVLWCTHLSLQRLCRPRAYWLHVQLLLLSLSGADYGQISEETWIYLSTLYGGGPEIAIRQNVAQVQELENLHGEQKIEAETRAV